MQILFSGDHNSNVITYFWSGYSNTIDTLREKMSALPPDTFNIGILIGSHTSGSGYRSDPALVDFLAAFAAAANHAEVFENIEAQAAELSSLQTTGNTNTTPRPANVKRIFFYFSGGYNAFEKMYDGGMFDQGTIYGIGHMDSLYVDSTNNHMIELAESAAVKVVAVHLNSANYSSSGATRPGSGQFHNDLNASGGLSIITRTRHGNIPLEYCSDVISTILEQT